MGDALLARLGQRLAEAFPHDRAYRLGGDEFCVLSRGSEEMIIRGCRGGTRSAHRARCRLRGRMHLRRGHHPHRGARRDRLPCASPTSACTRARSAASARPSAIRRPPPCCRRSRSASRSCATTSTRWQASPSRSGARWESRGDELDDLARAAHLHDVGKVAVPDAILQKPSELDPVEWEMMKNHAIAGERILSAAPALTSIASLVRSSHERWEGGGYPDGIAGEEIPLGARIIAACDAYHSMITLRVYGGTLDTAPGHRGAAPLRRQPVRSRGGRDALPTSARLPTRAASSAACRPCSSPCRRAWRPPPPPDTASPLTPRQGAG